MHAEFLLVDFEKMSNSLGNFYTMRDLLGRGTKPSSLRFLLASVPYRRQLNFNEDSLRQAASSVERLRNFVARVRNGKFPAGASAMAERAVRAGQEFEQGLEDDLNTAQALAAIFDLVREANTSMDRGEFRQDDAAPVLRAMEAFDTIFAVLSDDDAEKLRSLGIASDEGVLPAMPKSRSLSPSARRLARAVISPRPIAFASNSPSAASSLRTLAMAVSTGNVNRAPSAFSEPRVVAFLQELRE